MKLNIFLISFISLFFSFSKLQAQTEGELVDFLHSGTVTTENKIVKIPIEIWNNLILLKVKVNGNTATFMWDNGFSVSAIDNSLVQSYQFLPLGTTNTTISVIDGNTVKVDADYMVCPKIELKGITISNTPFLKLDIKAFTLTKELKIQGILGASIINKLNWRFDFDKSYLEISEQPFATDPANLVLPFNIADNNLHFMSIAFDGTEAECLVDFGLNSDEIEINKANAAHFSNAKAGKAFGQGSVSMGGLAPIDTVYTIKDGFTWELAGKKLDFRPNISLSRFRHNVVIGNRIFRDRYNVVVNTFGDTLYALSTRTKPNSNLSDKAHGYILLNVEGRFRIVQIISNANTIANAVQLNDEVVSINGRKPNDFKDNHSLIAYQKKLLRNQKKMVLKLVDGVEISIIPQPNIEFEFKNEEELW